MNVNNMIGTYKDFYKFVSIFAPYACKIWNDYHNRPDPQKGDLFNILYSGVSNVEYSVLHTAPMKTCKFVKVEFDPEFKNGVAFYYIFDCNGETIKIHSINEVDDIKQIKTEDYFDLFAFWTKCEPIKEKNHESI